MASPGVHIAASQDPTMFGGPFIDLPMEYLDDVRSYVACVERDRAEALKFAKDFKEFDQRLQASASGYSLNEWYEQLPPSLRGLVELVYDLNNRPKIRLLEELFDCFDLGLGKSQSLLLHRQDENRRPFFLSTPRFNVAESLSIRAPFGSDGVKHLISARNRAVEIEPLAKELGVASGDLARYFTDAPPAEPKDRNFDGAGVRIRYFGHASILIESKHSKTLIDPTYAWEKRADGPEHFTFWDLPAQIDCLALSHTHQDHLSPEVLMQLRDRVSNVLVPQNNRGTMEDPSAKRILKRLGFENITTLETLDGFDLPDGRITALPFSGEHADLDIASKQCFLVEIAGKRIGCFIDSDAIDPGTYARLADMLRDLDVMLVGMECNGAPLSWLYGPLTSRAISKRNDNSRRLSASNCERAWALTELIKPKRLFVYAMGQEPWMRSVMGLSYTPESIQLVESDELVRRCRGAGIPAQRLHLHMELAL